MSWIVEEYIRQLPYILETGDIDSDSYNNAIIIQKCIKNLHNKNLITDEEIEILLAVAQGYSYSEISRLFKLDRQTVSRVFDKITDRIAFILGGEFTDAAFLEKIQALGEISHKDASEIFKRGVIKHDR